MTRLQYTCPVAEVRVKSGLFLQCAYDCYKNLQNPSLESNGAMFRSLTLPVPLAVTYAHLLTAIM